jgi:hypothetical protein
MTEETVRPKTRAARDWLKKGPFAIAASTLQGGMNYAIVLYLSFGASLDATGEYRTLFSVYGLLALTSLLESNKVYIRSVVTEDAPAAGALFVNKLVFSLAGAILVAGGWGIGLAAGWFGEDSWAIPVVALLTALVYPFDLYLPHLQAERRFAILFVAESFKYLGSLAVFLIVQEATGSVGLAVALQLLFMGLCGIVFFFLLARRWIRPLAALRRFGHQLRSRPAKDARTLSLANLFPSSLEHVDKLVVGWVFGLAFLGVYTLAYSTGRFLYNILKPAMYVYYNRFVERMPGWPLLRRVGAIFTLLGVLMAGGFWAAVEWVPAMAQFESGTAATMILFCGYGIGIVHAAYSQAFALNKDSNARHALWAHVLATTGSLALLGAALVSPPAVALILLALQYPFRDGFSVLLMDRFRRRTPTPAGT